MLKKLIFGITFILRKHKIIGIIVKIVSILILTYVLLRYLGRIIGYSLLLISMIYLTYHVIHFFRNNDKNIHEFKMNRGIKLSINKKVFNFKSLFLNVGFILITGVLFYLGGNILSPKKNSYHYVHQKQLIRKQEQKKEYRRSYRRDRKKRTNPYGYGRKKRY